MASDVSGSPENGFTKCSATAARTSLLILTCILLWMLEPSPDTAIRAGSPLPLGAAGSPTARRSLPQKQQHWHDVTAAVDVVYLWVNGSDPQLQQELDQYRGIVPGQQRQYTAARYDSSRDELRYSLRSLEQYMPWYRHLYIVTNGQVPSWLDLSNPRVTVAPHSTIFENVSELPTFNSNGIQTKLLNIPGLADSFIVMDDDWFLTAPWTLQDFIGEDGAQVVTGSGLADKVKSHNPYLASIHYCNELFKQKFGAWPNRTDPTHSPHFMQRRWLEAVMKQLPEEYRRTGASRFRTNSDLLMAPAYEWYISQFQPGKHRRTPAERDVFTTLQTSMVRMFVLPAVLDTTPTDQRKAKWQQLLGNSNINHTEGALAVAAAVTAEAAGRPFPGVINSKKHVIGVLEKAWGKPGAKVVCVNDDATDVWSYGRQLLNPVVVKFLAQRYPNPSQYELPDGAERPCRRIKSTAFGKLATRADMAAACGAAIESF